MHCAAIEPDHLVVIHRKEKNTPVPEVQLQLERLLNPCDKFQALAAPLPLSIEGDQEESFKDKTTENLGQREWSRNGFLKLLRSHGFNS